MSRARLLLLALTAALMLAWPAPGLAADSVVWINELHYDNAGVDTAEGVEVAGAAGTNLSGWALQLYNGFDGRRYATVTLGGTIPVQQEHFGTSWFSIPGLQNGAPDGVALTDSSGRVVQFLGYEGTLTAGDGPAIGLSSAPIGPFEHPSMPAGRSLQLVGTGTRGSDFMWAPARTASADQVNAGQRFSGASTTGADAPAPGRRASPEVSTAVRGQRFPILRIRPHIDPAHARRLGAIRYVIHLPAIVRFTVQRIRPGRRSDGRCVAPATADVGAADCKRLGPILVTLVQHAASGRNVLRFGGRVKGRPLPAGTYRLSAVADAIVRRTSFRIVG